MWLRAKKRLWVEGNLTSNSKDGLFLPPGYVENPVASLDTIRDFWPQRISSQEFLWQVPVYKFAAKLVKQNQWGSVVDIGCGTGEKLMKFVAPHAPRVVGFDQPSGVRRAQKMFPNATWIDGTL